MPESVEMSVMDSKEEIAEGLHVELDHLGRDRGNRGNRHLKESTDGDVPDAVADIAALLIGVVVGLSLKEGDYGLDEDSRLLPGHVGRPVEARIRLPELKDVVVSLGSWDPDGGTLKGRAVDIGQRRDREPSLGARALEGPIIFWPNEVVREGEGGDRARSGKGRRIEGTIINVTIR